MKAELPLQKISSTSDEGSVIDQRERIRKAAFNERKRKRWITVALILAPVLIASLYLAFLAAPRYATEARFSVRSSVPQNSSFGGTASLFTTGANAGQLGGFVDGWAVRDFVKSRDGMHQLDQKIGLRKYLTYEGWDPVYRNTDKLSDEDLYRRYLAAVDISYNVMEQIDVLRVTAFSPDHAVLIATNIIAVAQDFVNKMDQKGIADTLKVSKQAVLLAEKEATDARTALTNWRLKSGNIDPVAESGMLFNLVTQLEAEYNSAQINLDKIRSLRNPDHPMLRSAELQAAALQKRLNETRGRLSGKGNTEASHLKTYEALKNAQTFADANLSTARQNYQQAFTETLKLQRYLTVIAKPISEDKPSGPRRIVILLEALAVGFVLAFLGRVGVAVFQDFKHG